MWLYTVLLLLCAYNVRLDDVVETEETKMQIFGIFNSGAEIQSRAFSECVNNANLDDFKLDPIIIKPYQNDSYTSWRTLCEYSNEANVRPIAVIGPQNPISDGAIKDQCGLKNIPHIQAFWQPVYQEQEVAGQDEELNTEDFFKRSLSLNFYPTVDDVSMAYAQLLKYYNWENYVVLYEDNFGLLRVQKIISEHSERHPITVHRLDPGGDNKYIFKDLVKNHDSRVLLDCDVDNAEKYIKEAESLGMVNDYQHYILTSLDTGTLIDKLQTLSANVSWLSMTNFEQLSDKQHSFTSRVGHWVSAAGEKKDSPPATKMKLQSLLMDDIVNHVMNAVQLIDIQKLKDNEPPNICDQAAEPWPIGPELLTNLIQNSTTGITNNIMFDTNGHRLNYTLFVNEIYVKQRHTLGRWHSATKDITIDSRPDSQINQQNRKHFTIISRVAEPYFYYINDTTDQYEGYSVDLAEAIFQYLRQTGYDYTYSFASDLKGKSYGKLDTTTKKWDGLIGDILSKKADLAIADLTITQDRKKVVDFSVPFMSLGISILSKKEQEKAPDTFSFLYPYSFEVWMYTATAYCVVSIILFVCSRISTADWENPQPCDKDPEELENIWNFKNCTWLTMGSIMTQGCDILPKAFGSRWVCGIWWFFAMIVCQTYIAQLSASLSSALDEEPIHKIEDLANQNKILYGAIYGGSTYEFFKNSKDKMYQKMFENMQANPVVFVTTNEEGVKFVINSKKGFAFFMESSTIEYKLKRNCDLKKVGGELDSKDYGIAMPSNSPFRSQINTAILKLQELTRIDEIKKKWWGNKYGAKKCKDNIKKGDVEGDLEMEHLIGVFLILIIGMILSIFITAVEFLNEVRNISIREQVPFKEALQKELRASLDFSKNQKPVLRNPSRAPSLAPGSIKSGVVGVGVSSQLPSVADFINFEKNL